MSDPSDTSALAPSGGHGSGGGGGASAGVERSDFTGAAALSWSSVTLEPSRGIPVSVLAGGRRGSTGVVMDPLAHSHPQGHPAYSQTPHANPRRLTTLYDSRLQLHSQHHHTNRYAPIVNACRCLNITLTVASEPQLSGGETTAVESLFGPADPQQHAATAMPSAQSSIFPDGYFAGRLVSTSAQHEALVFRRPHPLVGDAWKLVRCLVCHFDLYAHSATHQLIVVSSKAYCGDEIRKWKETDIFSRHFNILIRSGGGGVVMALPGGSPISSELHSGSNAVAATPSSSNVPGPILYQLKASFDHSLEVERIAMETRLSQMRALEESKFAEIEHKIRHQYTCLLAQVEREQESGLLTAQHSSNDTTSPRTGPFGARRNSRMFGHGKKGSGELVMFPEPNLGGNSSANEDTETNSISPSLTRVTSGTSPALIGPGSAGASSAPILSRTNSRGSHHSMTPPVVGTPDHAAAAAAAAAEHKAAASVVAVPLDLHRGASPATPSTSTVARRGSLAAPSPSPPPAPAHGSLTSLARSLPKNLHALPAAPILALPPPVDITHAPAASSAPSGTSTAVATPPAADLALSTPSAATSTSSHHAGISLVPFDEESTPVGMAHALSEFDDFTLPADDHHAASSQADTGIFDLDEDQQTAGEDDDAALSPQMRPLGGSASEPSDLEEDAEEDVSGASDVSGAEEEEDDIDPEPTAAPISSKAAKLLGMDGDARSRNSSAGGPQSVATTHAIVRPRTLSGHTGVTMVPMSLPIAIPAQLRAMVDEKNASSKAPLTKSGTSMRQQQPARQESGLGRSLKLQATLTGKSAPRLAPPASLVDSDTDDELNDRRRDADAEVEGAFMPPHTLVDPGFWSFSKVEHLSSYKEKTPRAGGADSPNQMRVQFFDANGAASTASPFGNDAAPPAMSSSVPRMVGPLGARHMVTPSAAQAQQPRLGFVANNEPPPPKPSAGVARGPSSRNPAGK